MSDLLTPGQIFAGRYRVVAFLAKGGFGAVYSAEQLDTEAKVALKVLWPHLLESDAAIEQFKLEARVSNRIGSEHVVRVYDVGREPDSQKAFLSMELLEGKDFEELIHEGGPLPASEVAVYFRQIASALEKAHAYVDRDGTPRPIVHRDLKPENLFLTHRETGEPCVKILDFGLAKVLGESGRTSNEFKGTPLFMSYEQASVGIITPQTDIWALGLIAFYFLTGQCYWLAASKSDTPITLIFSEVLSSPMRAPSARAKEIGATAQLSPGFDAWFARAVTRDRDRRFDTIGECIAELLLVLEEFADAPSLAEPVLRDTLGSTIPPLTPDAARTLQSAHPASLEVVSSPTLPLEHPTWSVRRGLLAFLGAAAFIALLVALRVSGKPTHEPAGGQEPRTVGTKPPESATSGPRPAPLPLPEARTVADAGAPRAVKTPSTLPGPAAAVPKRPRPDRPPLPPREVAPPASSAPLAPPPVEEDPYGSR